jgi:hypothetical protein
VDANGLPSEMERVSSRTDTQNKTPRFHPNAKRFKCEQANRRECAIRKAAPTEADAAWYETRQLQSVVQTFVVLRADCASVSLL